MPSFVITSYSIHYTKLYDYKFVMGFIIVVGSVVLLNLLVPLVGIPESLQQFVAVLCAILVGLVLGWVFSKAFTANIRRLNSYNFV